MERIPTDSTVPSTPSTTTQSPLSNGLSRITVIEPKKFSIVSFAANANPKPPIPRPATIGASLICILSARYTTPNTITIALSVFRKSGTSRSSNLFLDFDAFWCATQEIRSVPRNPNQIHARVIYTCTTGSTNCNIPNGKLMSGRSTSQVAPPAAPPAGLGTRFSNCTSSTSCLSACVIERSTERNKNRTSRLTANPIAMIATIAPHRQYSIPMNAELNQLGRFSEAQASVKKRVGVVELCKRRNIVMCAMPRMVCE